MPNAPVEFGAFYFNGRILGGAPGGVRRYAEQMLQRMPVRPIVLRPGLSRGPLGHLWEQLLLPSLAPGLLWSPANVGPLASSRQVVTIHDVAPLDHPEWFSPTFGRWYGCLLPRLARRAEHIITVSEFSKARIADRCRVPPSKITVTRLAPAGQFRRLGPAQAKDNLTRHSLPQAGFVLSVGTLEPRKNLGTLLRAWRQALPDLLAGLELIVVGSSGSASVFRSAGDRDRAPRVRWLGHLPEADLVALYSTARLFVFPSLYEGFGLPPLEAMACGSPVLCSRSSSLPEVVGDAAITFDPHDAAGLARLLIELLAAPARVAELGAGGPRHAARFSWDSCAARAWSVLEKAAHEGNSARQTGGARRAWR